MTTWLRRARPLLGTLVEIGLRPTNASADAVAAAFAALEEVQAQLSRFDLDSDISRFHGLRGGESLTVRSHTAAVLAAAQALRDASEGVFDISLGSAPKGWHIAAATLTKRCDSVRLDLGGIGKGYAVDHAVDVLMAHGCEAGWVNAGGDLRAFGDAELPLALRDEEHGGVRLVGSLGDGAFATSCFSESSRSQVAAERRMSAHASVAAPLCLWADALTKVVAVSGNAKHPLLTAYEASAWLH